jgi:hypothetical protein
MELMKASAVKKPTVIFDPHMAKLKKMEYIKEQKKIQWLLLENLIGLKIIQICMIKLNQLEIIQIGIINQVG